MEVSRDGVREAIWSLNTTKASGLDGLTGRMLRSLWTAVPEKVFDLFKSCAEEGIFPDSWKWANLAILLKAPEKDKNDVSSYRPISLIPTMGKVLERLMIGQLEAALEGTRVSRAQHGYKHARSTETAWMEVIRTVEAKPRQTVLGIFIDFTSAFDHLLWGPILTKLGELMPNSGKATLATGGW